MGKREKTPVGLMLTVLIIVGVSFLSFLTTPSKPIQAAPPLPTLPPQPTRTPTPISSPDTTKRRDEKPIGGYIELRVQPAQAGLWSVVQWQDAAGNWHDVEGWRGTVEGIRVWWVAEADFGKGPFRWVIYQGQDGPRLATSPPFYLPSQANQTLQIQVSSGL
jgi:hypothetical protein